LEQHIDNSRFTDPVQRHVSFDTYRDAVSASFQTWEEVSCSYLRFVETAPSRCQDVGYHRRDGNANRVFIRNQGWENPDEAYRTADQIAMTSVFFDARTGEILDVDIEINGEFFELTTSLDQPRTDIQNALTHEIGHLVGLAHSEQSGSTMHMSAREGETSKRYLTTDDTRGLCEIYPGAQDPDSCAEPPGGLDLECDDALWCADPVDSIVPECVFDEDVCCCQETGGFGHCAWTPAMECHTGGLHAVTQLSADLACEGADPGRGYNCCCQRGAAGMVCDWRQESADADPATNLPDPCNYVGIPVSEVKEYVLCGPLGGTATCQCTLAPAAAPQGLSDVVRDLLLLW
jgi:hypothetical protein